MVRGELLKIPIEPVANQERICRLWKQTNETLSTVGV